MKLIKTDNKVDHVNDQPDALSSRYARGPGKGRTTRVYYMQSYLAFLQETVSTTQYINLGLITYIYTFSPFASFFIIVHILLALKAPNRP